LPKILKSR